MPLRLIQARLPEDSPSAVADLLGDASPVDAWTIVGEDGARLLFALFAAEEIEAVTDRLAERFGGDEAFRVLVHSVEATVPRVEEEPLHPAEKERTLWSGWSRVSREELYDDLAEASGLGPVQLLTVALSTIVAAVGLIRGDAALIIGAMVIAPLLGPNMGLALASTLGDRELALRSLAAGAAGVVLAVAMSWVIGASVPFDPDVAELASRTRVGLPDVAVALAAGMAGALAYTSGLPTGIVGVMVAVALVPPLVATGLFLGAGQGQLAYRSGLLVITNLACVNLAGVATFLAQRVRPRTFWDAERARRATWIAIGSWLIALAALITAMRLAR